MGVSSLNTRNPMVLVMEKEFENVRRLLLEYTRLHVRSLIIINICNVIFCLSMMINIPLLITTEILLNYFLNRSLRELHKECNLRQVGKIVFGEDPSYDIYDININDVYNSTRELSTMKGKLSQAIYNLRYFDKLYIIISSISLGWALIISLIGYIVSWR